jgi:hypothetical protein
VGLVKRKNRILENKYTAEPSFDKMPWLRFRFLVRFSNNEDFLKKQHSLSKIAKMVLALQKLTEATQADEVDLDFLEEFLLKL